MHAYRKGGLSKIDTNRHGIEHIIDPFGMADLTNNNSKCLSALCTVKGLYHLSESTPRLLPPSPSRDLPPTAQTPPISAIAPAATAPIGIKVKDRATSQQFQLKSIPTIQGGCVIIK
ncbi:uncharacterized, partial [Tachysurus ichikawai]